jgi:hypothetical protein
LLQYSPANEPRSGWADEIDHFRDEIEDRLTASLRRDLQRQLPRLYGRARSRAKGKLERYGETEAAAQLPERCPYALEEILGDFWPPLDASRPWALGRLNDEVVARVVRALAVWAGTVWKVRLPGGGIRRLDSRSEKEFSWKSARREDRPLPCRIARATGEK